jgi:hypothetical protein
LACEVEPGLTTTAEAVVEFPLPSAVTILVMSAFVGSTGGVVVVVGGTVVVVLGAVVLVVG